MKTFLTVSITLALTALANAQDAPAFQTSLTTADAVGVQANRQHDAARTGTAIDRGLALRAADGDHASSASLAARHLDGAGFEWRGAATSGNLAQTTGGSPLAAGPQSYVLELQARQPITGTVMIQFGGVATNGRAGATVALGRNAKRFGADGARHSDSFAGVTLGARPVQIAIELSGITHPDANTRAGQYDAHLSISFVPDHPTPNCTVTVGSRSCPEGGLLGGAATVDRAGIQLDLVLRGALANAIGLTIASPDGLTSPIGRSSCTFFDTAIVLGTFNTDANGAARTSMRLPARVGAGVSLQQGSILIGARGVQVATSNTVDVTCR